MQKNKDEMEIRKALLQLCNQEDMSCLNTVMADKRFLADICKFMVKARNKFYIMFLGRFEASFMSLFVTQKCTLKCQKCSDLIPFYKNPQSFQLKSLIKDTKRYLSAVDSVHFFLICGGETFLYPDLEDLIKYLVKQRKIRHIGITTNGTIIPADSLCRLLAKEKIIVRVSDYKCVHKKRVELIKKLKKHGIFIDDLRGQKWYDVGEFENRNRNQDELAQLYKECRMKRCFEINQGKVIYCARQRGGELGLMPLPKRFEYVSLDQRNGLRNDLLNMYNIKYLSTCNYCDGIMNRSKRVVPGLQERKEG